MKWVIISIISISIISLAVAQLQVGNPDNNERRGVFLVASEPSTGDTGGGNGSFNNTNIAYLNNTQTFTGINTFDNNIIFNGNLSADDKINIISDLDFGEISGIIRANLIEIKPSGSGARVIRFTNSDLTSRSLSYLPLFGIFQLNDDIAITTMTSAGFVKNSATGLLSGGNSIDISADTNLDVDSPITLTEDTIGFDFSTNNIWTGINEFQTLINASNLTFNLGAVDCPEGNYSFGFHPNGTQKCRNDESGGTGDFNNTNIAYLNNTQTFTGINTFDNNIIFNGNLSAEDNEINIGVNNNITIYDNSNTCFRWLSDIGFRTHLCYLGSGVLRWFGNEIQFAFDSVSFGDNIDPSVRIDAEVGGIDGFFQYHNGSEVLNQRGWRFSNSITSPIWYASLTSNKLFPSNITWLNPDSTNPLLRFNVPNSIFIGNLNFTGNLNGCSDSQVVMGDGRCVENNTIGQSGGGTQHYLSIEVTSVGNNILEPANPFNSSNYGSFNYINFSNSDTIIYNPNTGSFTIPETGNYLLTVNGNGAVENGYGRGVIEIFVNGILNATRKSQSFVSTGDEEWGGSATAALQLDSGDNVTVGLSGADGAPLCPCSFNIGDRNAITIHKID